MILIHICEVCGKTKTMDSEEAFHEGWDYPPRMGTFGTLSPRTCGDCGIEKTLWWRVTAAERKQESYPWTDADRVLMRRVSTEPGSILGSILEKEKNSES